MVTLKGFSTANYDSLIPTFGNVSLDLDLFSNKVYVGNWGMENPLISGQTCGA